MTPAQFLYNFRIGFDVIASGAAPGFTDTQVYSLLNRAQDYIIDELIETKKFDLLGPLTKQYLSSEASASSSNGYLLAFTLPTDYWRYGSSQTTLTRSAFSTTGIIKSRSGTLKVDNIFVDPKEFDRFEATNAQLLYNSYMNFKNPIITIKGYNYEGSDYETSFIIRGDSYATISSAEVVYVRERLDISASQTSELLPKVHRQIVDKAIDIAKVIINVQTPQSSNT